jgi:hypothetical protein
MPELLIRPSIADHKVVADLLAPSPLGGRRPIDRVVINAQDAARSEELVGVVQRAGVPLLVDPVTFLLQGDIDPTDPWVRLPFGQAAPLADDALLDPFVLDKLVAQVIQFEVEQGATAIVPPYFYCASPDSPAFAATLAAIGRTARRMRADGVRLPLVPVLCVQQRAFAHRSGWQGALDRFAAAAVDVGPQSIGLQLSPLGDGSERYAKLLDTVIVSRHLRSVGTPVLAWRQGVYGPALVAAGLDGYECGMGIGEKTNIPGFVSSRKPRENDERGRRFAAYGVYIPVLGRSVPPRVAQILFDDRRLRGRLTCDSVRCCPRGLESMMASKGRSHAVRARARELQELAEIPNTAWRLNHIAKQAARGYVTALKANEVLAQAKVSNRLKTEGFEALEQVAEFLRTHGAPSGVRDSA